MYDTTAASGQLPVLLILLVEAEAYTSRVFHCFHWPTE